MNISRRHVVALKGGLGNQLFQFSFALFLARQAERVDVDLSCVRHGVPAIFQVPLIGDRSRHMVLPVTRFMPSPSGRLTQIGTLSRKAMRPARIVLDESAQGPRPSPSLSPAWWFGYWQRLTYAEAVIPLLRTGLLGTGRAPTPPSKTVEQNQYGVARVHVRRGDYAGNPMELSAEWYKRALDIACPAGGHTIEVEVVTNDQDWCRRNLDLGRPYKLRPPGSAVEDMRSLAAADFLVISRSTFSWWAAAISEATVVAPAPWFPTMSKKVCEDLLPAKWMTCQT